MIKQYNITDYIKDDPELQKAVIEEFLNDIKLLQAENEELKKQIEKQKNAKVQLKNLDSRFADDYCKVKAENEQLKALCDTYLTCYRAKHNDIEGNLFLYRKALEEIREILKGNKDGDIDEMIDKISEVLDD